MFIKIALFAFIMIVLAFVSCHKDFDSNQEQLIGKWISIDKSDTIDFVNKLSFFKSSRYMRYDHYDYQLNKDSIKIGYSGVLYILVIPARYKYYLNVNNLTIDFSNKPCFGFEKQIVNYTKE